MPEIKDSHNLSSCSDAHLVEYELDHEGDAMVAPVTVHKQQTVQQSEGSYRIISGAGGSRALHARYAHSDLSRWGALSQLHDSHKKTQPFIMSVSLAPSPIARVVYERLSKKQIKTISSGPCEETASSSRWPSFFSSRAAKIIANIFFWIAILELAQIQQSGCSKQVEQTKEHYNQTNDS